jgi:dipeptidyl aminopeptidase/acylaminoacyl peptidase
MQIIRQTSKVLRLDPRRLHLLGHSMGGGGVWAQCAILHSLWASAGAAAGWYQVSIPPPIAELKTLPFFLLHGDKDDKCPVRQAQWASKVLEKLGSEAFKYRQLKGQGHSFFGHAAMKEMMDWVLTLPRETPADLNAAELTLKLYGERFGWTPGLKPLGEYQPDSSVVRFLKERENKKEQKEKQPTSS